MQISTVLLSLVQLECILTLRLREQDLCFRLINDSLLATSVKLQPLRGKLESERHHPFYSPCTITFVC